MNAVTVLGLGPSPRTHFIYIDGDARPHGWRFWDYDADTPIVIEEESLLGYITAMQIVDKNSAAFGKKEKLRIDISCGRALYVIECGATTSFAKSFLLSLERAGKDQLGKLMIIAPERGGKGKAVFCQLYDAENAQLLFFGKDNWVDDEGVEKLFTKVHGWLSGPRSTQSQERSDPRLERARTGAAKQPQDNRKGVLLTALVAAKKVYNEEGDMDAAHGKLGEAIGEFPDNWKWLASHAFKIMVDEDLSATAACKKANEQEEHQAG